MNKKRIMLTVVAAIAFVIPSVPLHQKGDMHVLLPQAGVLVMYVILFAAFRNKPN